MGIINPYREWHPSFINRISKLRTVDMIWRILEHSEMDEMVRSHLESMANIDSRYYGRRVGIHESELGAWQHLERWAL